MKKTITIMLCLLVLIGAKASSGADTVVIELSNKSKILIYTENKEELQKLQQYDINEMIKDLNNAIASDKVKNIELQDASGNRYTKDTTIIVGDGDAKTSIRIGNMELLVDADEWDDIDDEFEDAFDDDEPFRKYSYESRNIDRTKTEFNIDVGLQNWVEGGTFPDADDQSYTLKPFGSWTVGFNFNNKTWVGGPLYLNWALGASWHNFNLQDTDHIIAKGADRIEFVASDPTHNTKKSRLTVPYANVTIVPMLDFSRGRKKVKGYEKGGVTFRTYKRQGIRIGLGGYAGYRLGGESKYVYSVDGNKEKDKDSGNFYLSNMRYGIRGQFGFKGLDIFMNYDLNDVFAEGRGPAGSGGLQAISFGIIL
ncbi:MAG: hypothetical protein ACI9A7_001580 [Cyclobacteriaceae bacterium]|jgi:hypothetical protein